MLEQHGRGARIYELHGDLLFAGAESVVREITQAADELELVALDLRRINDVAEVSRRLLGSLHAALHEQGCEPALIDPDGLLPVAQSSSQEAPLRVFQTIAEATTWFEDELLDRHADGTPPDRERFGYADHPLLGQIPSPLVEELQSRMVSRSYASGELIVAEGDAKAGLFLILSGRVRSSLTTVGGAERTLAIRTPGTCFGELSVVTDTPHPVSMNAEGPVEALELTREAFAEIGQEDSEVRAAVLEMCLFAIHDDVDRRLRGLATSRVTPMTSS